jgi:hypothetical protein
MLLRFETSPRLHRSMHKTGILPPDISHNSCWNTLFQGLRRCDQDREDITELTRTLPDRLAISSREDRFFVGQNFDGIVWGNPVSSRTNVNWMK